MAYRPILDHRLASMAPHCMSAESIDWSKMIRRVRSCRMVGVVAGVLDSKAMQAGTSESLLMPEMA